MSDTNDSRPEATTTADTYGRHEPGDPSKAEQAVAVTGRPPDTPQRGVDEPAVPNSTFAERSKARRAGAKAVDADDEKAENKAVSGSQTTTKRRARK